MKHYCDGCGKRLFKRAEDVYICSYESTYCEACAAEKKFECGCCEGKLEKRPARIITEIKVIPLENIHEIFIYNVDGNLNAQSFKVNHLKDALFQP